MHLLSMTMAALFCSQIICQKWGHVCCRGPYRGKEGEREREREEMGGGREGEGERERERERRGEGREREREGGRDS